MRWFAVLAVPVLALSVGAGPADAAGDDLQLSLDGVRWVESIERPLFDPQVRWVPGDERVAQFFARNTRNDAGDLTVDVLRAAQDDLVDTGWLDISARSGAGEWTTIDSGGTHRLVGLDGLAGAGEVPVNVRVRMPAEAPNGTMVLASDLDFRVTLTDSDVADDGSGVAPSTAADPGGPVGDQIGSLPDTGSTIPPWLPPLGLLLIGVGAYLAARRRDPHTT